MNELQDEFAVYDDEQTGTKGRKCSPFVRNIIISVGMVVTIAVVLAFWFLFRPDNKTEHYELFNVKMISELTTLECRYHNVSVYEKEGNWLGIGRQYVWFEYDVIVEIGIDINQVHIENPTEDGVVRVYLPAAEIQGVAVDKETIKKPVEDLGAFTQLTTDEEMQIVNDGVEKLRNDAQTQAVVYQAYASAKEILKQYIINVGAMIGEEYTVEWIEAPENIQNVPDDYTG